MGMSVDDMWADDERSLAKSFSSSAIRSASRTTATWRNSEYSTAVCAAPRADGPSAAASRAFRAIIAHASSQGSDRMIEFSDSTGPPREHITSCRFLPQAQVTKTRSWQTSGGHGWFGWHNAWHRCEHDDRIRRHFWWQVGGTSSASSSDV